MTGEGRNFPGPSSIILDFAPFIVISRHSYPMTEPYFQHWWAQFLAGDREAFGKLYRPVHPKLTLYCYKYLRDMSAAEDAASEALQKLYAWPDVASVRDFERWLFTAARNVCLDQLKKEKRRGEIREDVTRGASAIQRPEVEQHLQMEVYEERMRRALSEKEHAVWQRHLQGYNNEEIARQTGSTEKTVANLKSMARQKLREALKNQA